TGKDIALRRSRRRFGWTTSRSMVQSHFIWRTGRKLTSTYARVKPNRMPSVSNSTDVPLRCTRNLQRQSVPGERLGEPGSLPSELELEPHHCPSGTTPRTDA